MYRSSKTLQNLHHCCTLLATVALCACTAPEDTSLQPKFDSAMSVPLPAKQPVPYAENNTVFYGDLHIHTSLSTDAFAMGGRSLPDDVYRFARGAVIEHGAGYPVKISRPLDFAAVTDHAEYLGQAREANLDVPTTRRSLREMLLARNKLAITLAWLESSNFIRENGFGYGENTVKPATNLSAWQLTIDAAQRYNEAGVFTAFIAYEWSAFAGSPMVHMHRNVIFRGSDVADIPFSALDSQRPEDLWNFLKEQSDLGHTAFAIPHNANLSGGSMYAPRDSDGEPLTAQYAKMRSRYEPISEVFQIKGSSETHPLLSVTDEFANFEISDLNFLRKSSPLSVKGGYMRDALRVGMELSHSEGFNPFKFGVIGASDSHNATSPSDENDYTGKLPMLDGSAGLRTNEATLLPDWLNPAVRWGSGGLAGVWAHENTRAALFDAMRRRETFATSGPRMSVRLFAGWDYTPAILNRSDVVGLAYARGVPMGAQLSGSSGDTPPHLIVLAAKDPEGANLDRVQIIKGWIDAAGDSHERIYNVALSGGRAIDPATGASSVVGNTVDVHTARYTNRIGAAQLSALWIDKDFKAEQNAFYYARVLEIPTPRWSTFDAVALGTNPLQPSTIQERAVTSAIWYSPQK